jgi:hypothetical protein
MYGIGSRLDKLPELLFLLRGVDSAELIASAADAPAAGASLAPGEALGADELADVFGVDFEAENIATPAVPTTRKRGRPKKAAKPPAPVAAPAKKPRGRPKKAVALPPPSGTPVKRPRGRPKAKAS